MDVGQNIPQKNHTIGVIGSGRFGMTLAHIISANRPVFIYARNEEVKNRINSREEHKGLILSDNVIAINDLEQLALQCTYLIPVIPSSNMRNLMMDLAPYVNPQHMVLHATKGLDTKNMTSEDLMNGNDIDLKDVKTMSQVIHETTSVARIGCLSGPNLALEIAEGQPTATVIASKFNEVIRIAQVILKNPKFYVFGESDILAAELAGAFKNYIALGSGILSGKGFGQNLKSLLISKGLREMIHLGKLLGSSPRVFLGTAGIADLIATSTSENSRNFSVGLRLASGESLETILSSMDEIAEGIRTLAIANKLADRTDTQLPITRALYNVVFKKADIEKQIIDLMSYPFNDDVDFL